MSAPAKEPQPLGSTTGKREDVRICVRCGKEMQMVAAGRIDPGLLKQSRQALANRHLLNQDHASWLLAKDLRYKLHADYEDFDMMAAVSRVTSVRLADFAQKLYLNESYVLK